MLSAEGAKAQDHLWFVAVSISYSELIPGFREELVQILSKVDPRITATVDKYLTHNIAV